MQFSMVARYSDGASHSGACAMSACLRQAGSDHVQARLTSSIAWHRAKLRARRGASIVDVEDAMRKHCLGAPPHTGSWSPQFLKKERVERDDKVGRRNTSFMTYFPTIKGEWRSEGLRHYFHKNYALILDAMSEVECWTGAATSIVVAGQKPFEFTPDFFVYEATRSYAVRLLRGELVPESPTRRKHAAASDAYETRGQSLVIMTAAELAEHLLLPAAKSLFLNRVRDWPSQLPSAIADRWSDACPTTLGALHVSMGGDSASWLQLLSLVAHGFVQVDLHCGLHPQTPVTACRHAGYRHGR
jgi:hypothetical protein